MRECTSWQAVAIVSELGGFEPAEAALGASWGDFFSCDATDRVLPVQNARASGPVGDAGPTVSDSHLAYVLTIKHGSGAHPKWYIQVLFPSVRFQDRLDRSKKRKRNRTWRGE